VEIERITRNDDADEAVLNLKAEWDECKSKLLSVYNRYVRSILRQLGEHDFVEDTYYNAIYKVTPEDYLRLRDVESTLTLNFHDIYEVLERILVNIESTSHEEQTWLRKLEKYLAISLFEATQLVLIVVSPVYATWLVARMQLDWTRKVPGILLTLFLISVVWTWKHLYEQAIAEKAAELAQSIPPECNPQEMTWQQAIWGYFVAPSMTVQKKTACAKYHEMLMVNPLWTVPPTQAVAVTVIRIVLLCACLLRRWLSP
ncbi:PREDICTED: chloride channel CLIC-like protein 1, partial [Priapulus caudatus]|uniref:Chloride channel CLIC-like protein 1 n=1 Tax=Priapulus caudatus TaxID=37621 RepID=A0ABM1E7A2_PRICU